MAKDFEFKGVWIPGRVFLDKRLTQSDKFLFGLIHILCNERGCFATRESLSEYMGQSVRNVQYGVQRLIDAGYVRRDEAGVLWDIITHVIDKGEAPFTGGVKVSSPRGCRKLHPDSNKDRHSEIVEADAVYNPSDVGDQFIRSNKDLSDVWDKWLEFRRGRRWASGNAYVKRWNGVFALWGAPKAIEAVQQSLLQGWQGIFEPKVGRSSLAPQPKSDSDHAKGF
jgi:hypothetical protein